MATRDAQTEQIKGFTKQLQKAKGEILKRIDDLEAAQANSGNTTPAEDEAMEALRGEVQGLDDVNPDAVDPNA